MQNDIMKNSNNPLKFHEIKNMLDKADKLNQSQTSEVLNTVESAPGNQRQNSRFDELSIPSRSMKTLDNYPEENHYPRSEIHLSNKKSSMQFEDQLSKSQDVHYQMKQLDVLQKSKKDMETLYKEYILTILDMKDNKNLLKFEKCFNDQIKKMQDYMDILEDQLL